MSVNVLPGVLESYFSLYRSKIIGVNKKFNTPFGQKPLVYADWTASGRLYEDIEHALLERFYPWVANTHTDTNFTGSSMTYAYHKAQTIIKKHVNAGANDVLISSNSGMTGVVNKFQRILGLKTHESHYKLVKSSLADLPVVFVSHMEHHSNQTSWLETLAEVVIVEPTEDGLFSLNHLEELLLKYKDRQVKIAAVTSCSNVTGIVTPYHQIAAKMHQHGGLCFVDFACSAPYININMHPENPEEALDAIYFSPHKFLGGPGTTGILIFNNKLYKNSVPDHPGGGTVDWTNPWGKHKYTNDIEAREDGGTPAFLQTIKVALCIELKEQMGVEKIMAREHELINIVFDRLTSIKNLSLLAGEHKNRLAVFSFNIEGLHFNLAVKLLNDRYGIQVRGGCSCAGTYGHYLLNLNESESKSITDKVTSGDFLCRPGWVRMSLHPTTTNSEINYILNAIEELSLHHNEWGKDYTYNPESNSFRHSSENNLVNSLVDDWFKLS